DYYCSTWDHSLNSALF
nr:immunoglobulin light chain junction region [Macaca mulatta]